MTGRNARRSASTSKGHTQALEDLAIGMLARRHSVCDIEVPSPIPRCQSLAVVGGLPSREPSEYEIVLLTPLPNSAGRLGLYTMAGSEEDAEMVTAFFEDMMRCSSPL
jgi:hypothetical protein